MSQSPQFLLLIASGLAWIGLLSAWSHYIRGVTERRREIAVARGEEPPSAPGLYGHHGYAIRVELHREAQKTDRERWTGRGIAFGIPFVIVLLSLSTLT